MHVLTFVLAHVDFPFIDIMQLSIVEYFNILSFLHYLCFILDSYAILMITPLSSWEAIIAIQNMQLVKSFITEFLTIFIFYFL